MMRQKTYVLAKAILERKDILFGNSENVFKPQILKEKEDAWEAVRLEMIDQGFEQFQRKSWRDVRNHDWQYLRRSAVAKYEHNQKPGVEAIPYNDVDRVVFEIMGNEPFSSTNDCVNGAIAASYNWLKTESPQHQNNISFDGLDSNFFHQFNPTTALSFTGTENNSSSLNSDQEQINSLLNSALAASASMLGRKMSWETCCSPSESPREKQQQQRHYHQPQQQIQQNNEIELLAERNKETTANGLGPNRDLLKSIIAASSTTALPPHNQPQNNNLEQIAEVKPSSVSSGIITSSTSHFTAAPTTTTTNRKRQHSPSSGGGGGAGRSIEDEIQEARLKHILLQVKREDLQVKREEILLQVEKAKLRQEQIKMELLERQLKASNDRSD